MAKDDINLKKMLGKVTLDDYKEAIKILDENGWDKKYDAEADNEYWVLDEHGEKKKYPVKMVMRKLLELKETGYDDGTMKFNSINAKEIIENIPGRTEYGIDFSEKRTPELEKPALNQILYGPPGTGKTYNTIIKAMEIIDGEKYTDSNGNLLDPSKYDDLKKQFATFKEQGRIEFVTFHQSYSYEEFVEGIRPVIKNNEKNERENNKKNEKDIQFEYHDGIFKKMCNNKIVDWDKTFEKFKKKFDNNELPEFEIERGGRFKVTKCNDSLEITRTNTEKNSSNSAIIEKFKEAIRHKINDEMKKKDIYKEIGIGNGLEPQVYRLCKYIREEMGLEYISKVLIIDEINRGNISKIFGELITLIEPDKRENVTGDETREYHTIEVTLPYSNEPFTVPNNLYIIGTMNTADKSLTLLDVALRRRFEFIPMYPQYENIANMHYGDFLKKLNNNILVKKNYNADYLIGHSYFIGKEAQDLKNVLNKKVIPLLMEYFNGKIETVKEILDSCGYTLTYDSNYSVDGKGEKYFYLQVKKAEPKQKQNTFGEQNSKPTDEQKTTENES